MHKLKDEINHAIRNKSTVIAEHYYCEVLKEPLILEVYPYKLDGDFLICYDLKADMPYVIDLKQVIKLKAGEKRDLIIPELYKR